MNHATSTATLASEGSPPAARLLRPQLGVGIALLCLAALTLADAFRLATMTGVGVGPSAAMKLVGVFIGLLGLAHLVVAWRQRATPVPQPDADDKTNPAALAWVLGGLIGQIVMLLTGGGFILGSTILFVATARGFGRKVRSMAPVYGFILSTLVYVFFTKALSLSLPAGPLERLF